MRTIGWVIIGLVVVIILLLVGIIVGRVGGIAIRKQGATQSLLSVVVSEPVVRGVPIVVRWDKTLSNMPLTLTFEWRDEENQYPLGTATWEGGQATLQFPCAAAASTGGLVVRSVADGKVVGNQLIELAPAGPECVQ